MNLSKGVIVTSDKPHSGKTVISSGIVGAILSLGLYAEAVKPYEYGIANNDIKYIVQVTKRPSDYNPVLIDNWAKTNTKTWNNLLSICRNFPYPVLLESPCCVSTPLKADSDIFDCINLSETLSWPILLVTNAAERPYESLVQALSFLKHRNANLIGFITTCSKQNIDYLWFEELVNTVVVNYGVNCLGMIPFSPSISREENRQGNIIKLTQQYIDLLPIQTQLNLTVVC